VRTDELNGAHDAPYGLADTHGQSWPDHYSIDPFFSATEFDFLNYCKINGLITLQPQKTDCNLLI